MVPSLPLLPCEALPVKENPDSKKTDNYASMLNEYLYIPIMMRKFLPESLETCLTKMFGCLDKC